MNIDLIDKDQSQIQATFFNDAAEKFDKILRENKVYLFANGFVKMANKKFTPLKMTIALLLMGMLKLRRFRMTWTSSIKGSPSFSLIK